MRESRQKKQAEELAEAYRKILAQVRQAVLSIPGLNAQAKKHGGIDEYAETLLDLWRRQAVVASKHTGENPSDIFNRTIVKALQRSEDNSGQRDEQTLWQFVGQQGADRLDAFEQCTRRLDDLAVAREMEKANKNAKKIKLGTGWERGADGKWRYETEDPKFNNGFGDYLDDRRPHPLWKIFIDGKNNIVFKAYPELLDFKIQIFGRKTEFAGAVFFDDKLIKVSDRLVSEQESEIIKELFLKRHEDSFENVVYHEIQHVIQEIEGFAKGGQGRFNDIDYYNLAGEVEARNAQKRSKMSANQRLATLASETEDVAREDQIVLRDGLKSAAMSPLNYGVDPDIFVRLTWIKRKFSETNTLKELRKAIMNSVELHVVEILKEGVENKNTGWIITMSGNDIKEHLKSDPNSKFIGDQYEAITALPSLIEKAVLVESHLDKHGRKEIKNIHRFYAPLYIENDLYSIQLTVKEYEYGIFSVDKISSKKLYHHRIQKKMSFGQRGSANNPIPEPQPKDILGVTLRELLIDVNDNDGNKFFDLADNGIIRGSVTTSNSNYTINLFENANLSTLAHEMGHVFFLELERAVQQGHADTQIQADYKTLCKWVGAEEGQKLTLAQHEQLARSWEAYLMEGEAPSSELKGVFARFREWLLDIYRTVKTLGVELNDDVRGVFDRMLTFDDSAKEILASDDSFDSWCHDCVSGNFPEIGQIALCVDLEDGRVFRDYEPCGKIDVKDKNKVILSVYQSGDIIDESNKKKSMMMKLVETNARISLRDAMIEWDKQKLEQKNERVLKLDQGESQERKTGHARR